MSEKLQVPWTIAEENSKIVLAHCNCMAGLDESCSHEASIRGIHTAKRTPG